MSTHTLEPQLSFWHAELKIVWAKKLINDLNAAVRAYIQSKPYQIRLQEDAGTVALIVDTTKPMPFSIPCLTGDICHNLRASLDFCWMGLHRSVDKNCEKATLPIASNEKGLITTAQKAFKGSTQASVIKLLVERIRPHQDFDRGGNRAICALSDLSNWQKHNLLVSTLGVTELPDDAVFSGSDGSTIRMGRARINGRVAKVGGTQAKLTYNGEPTVEILIKTKHLVGAQSLIPLMLNFLDATTQAHNAFREGWPGCLSGS